MNTTFFDFRNSITFVKPSQRLSPTLIGMTLQHQHTSFFAAGQVEIQSGEEPVGSRLVYECRLPIRLSSYSLGPMAVGAA